MTEPWISEIIANAAKNTYENVVKELDQLKAENEALQAQVAALVETVRKMNRFFNCPSTCGIDAVDNKREDAFEEASNLCDSALKDHQPTADAFIQREKAEAVRAERERIKKRLPDAEFIEGVTGMEAVYMAELEGIIEDRRQVAIVFEKPNKLNPQQPQQEEKENENN